MAKIYNNELIQELANNAKIQTSRDKIPNELAEKIVPVLETNPEMFRRSNIVRYVTNTNSTSQTIYTTPSDRDFYLTACSLSIIKDATSTSVSTNMNIEIDESGGSVPSILAIPGISLTAQSETVSLSLPYPIKLKRGSNIAITNSTNVANITAKGCIVGYIDESSRA